MHNTFDFIIIGGGVNGLLTAKELLQESNNIAIIDKNQVGQESSWAGGGILLPLYPWRQAPAISDLVMHSLTLYPSLSQELTEATQIDPEWIDCGLLISKNPDVDDAVHWCEQRNIHYSTDLGHRLDSFNTRAQHPLWLPDIAQARNPRLLKSLIKFLADSGITFIENCQIESLQQTQGRATRLSSAHHTFSADNIIVTTGAWTDDFLTRHLPRLPSVNIQPVRGQMLLFEAHPDTLSHMILDADRYLIPRKDGKILAGSTVEQAGFEKVTSETAREELFQFATTLFPALKQFNIGAHWAGLRPGSPQGVPYICRHPELNNLFINAGHFRNGLVMAPASARLLVDMILDRPPAKGVNPNAYQFSR